MSAYVKKIVEIYLQIHLLTEEIMYNNLKYETSPYLLQHSQNPVNWYPWCDEAFNKAKAEDKPVFLSIGYSTCHWCHVMAHESFEDTKTADILNNNFISVKVDREERPDIDSVYMSVCMAFTGSGGWPMSVFMSWDKKPFFAGTYFPPHSVYGMVGFQDLLNMISNLWKSNRGVLMESSQEALHSLTNRELITKCTDKNDLIEKAAHIFRKSFDEVYGGFGNTPKFPTPHSLIFLMLYAGKRKNNRALEMAEKTLVQMRKGGIFDHIGYGFSRYSTDRFFLAPHFEKMLYDNALLIIAYSALYSITNEKIYLDTAEKTAQYVLREMTSEDGGYFSAQDADSEGVEGKYYTFSKSEVIKLLGDKKGNEFSRVFDITDKGNFEGLNIPNLLKSNDLTNDYSAETEKLYDYRKKRFTLYLDDKILLSWNSLMIGAMAMLYRASQNEKYLNSAQKALKFIEKNMTDGLKLYSSFREGRHTEKAFLDDYAFFIFALTELYNSTMDKTFLKKAESFSKETLSLFSDHEKGGFYFSTSDNSELFIKPKETYDGAMPSGNSVMAYNFVRLYQLTEKELYKDLSEKQLSFMADEAQYDPQGFSMFLIALIIWNNPPKHITVILKDKDDLGIIKDKLPFFANVSVISESEEYPLLNDMTTYVVCENNVCLKPTNRPDF